MSAIWDKSPSRPTISPAKLLTRQVRILAASFTHEVARMAIAGGEESLQ
jgi:hypothetical protein